MIGCFSTGPNEVNRTWIYSADETEDSSQPDFGKNIARGHAKDFNGSSSFDNSEHHQTTPYSNSQGNSSHKQHSLSPSNHGTGQLFRHQSDSETNCGHYSKGTPSDSELVPSKVKSKDRLHLPLKEYELPSFLKKNGQVKRSSPGGTHIIQQDVGDFDVEVSSKHHQHSSLMIPMDQLRMPEFLKQKTIDYDRKSQERSLPVGEFKTARRSPVLVRQNMPKDLIKQKLYNPKTQQVYRTDDAVSSRQKGHTERNMVDVDNSELYHRPKQQEQGFYNYEPVSSQADVKKCDKQQSSASIWSKAQMSAVADDLNMQLKFNQGTNVDQTSSINGHEQLNDTSVDNSIKSVVFDDASLQRKYKRKDKSGIKQDKLVITKEPKAAVEKPSGELNEKLNATVNNHFSSDTESFQSNSSNSFSHSNSHQAARTRNHIQQDWLGFRVSPPDKLSPRATKLTTVNKDFHQQSQELHSASPEVSSAMHDSSPCYADSSYDEDSSKKVKRKNSLQAQLRKKIQRYEAARISVGGGRERYDSDSTTISGASFVSDSLPRSSPRKYGINELPDDLLMRILNYLPTSELCKSSGVCRKWHYLCWDPELWTCITILNYQDSNINRVLKNLLSKLAVRTQGYCLTVQSVKLNGCELLSDKALGCIAQFCIDVVELQIAGCCCITSKGLQDILTRCHNLCFIDLTGCSCVNSIFCLSNNGFSTGNRSSFLQLKHLNLSDCVAFDDLGLRTVGLCCGLLETLYLRRCNRVTDVGIKHVANHCLMLKELSVSDCYKVRDFSLKEVSKHVSGLKYLSVAKCPVTDAGVKCIGKRCVRLKYLNIRGCEGVSDVGVIHVVQNCLKLRSLDIGKCSITDSSLQTIAIHCPQLKKLSLKGCTGISDTGVKSIAAQCCSLQYLNVQECNLDYETFAYIRGHCRHCIIEHTCPAFF